MEQHAIAKPEAPVQSDGSVVVGSNVQKRSLATFADFLHDCAHQCCSIPAAYVIGMRADRTHLCIAWNAQALSRHCDQSSIPMDSEICPKFVGSFAKRSGLGELRQSDHLRNISFGKFDDVGCVIGYCRAVMQHLQEGRGGDLDPASGWSLRSIKEKCDSITSHQRSQ